jgi:hypothetical protein
MVASSPARSSTAQCPLDDVPAGYRAMDDRESLKPGGAVTTWSRDDLDLLGGAGRVEVSSVRRDGSLSRRARCGSSGWVTSCTCGR